MFNVIVLIYICMEFFTVEESNEKDEEASTSKNNKESETYDNAKFEKLISF